MSEANIEVVRRLFDSYVRGDYAEAATCLAVDVVYEVGQELPARGREAVRAAGREVTDEDPGELRRSLSADLPPSSSSQMDAPPAHELWRPDRGWPARHVTVMRDRTRRDAAVAALSLPAEAAHNLRTPWRG